MSAVPGWEHVDFEIMSYFKLMAFYMKRYYDRLKKKEKEEAEKNSNSIEQKKIPAANTNTNQLASIWNKPPDKEKELEEERKKRLKEQADREKAQREKFELLKQREAERQAHEEMMKQKDLENKEYLQREAKFRLEAEEKKKAAELEAQRLAQENALKNEELRRQDLDNKQKISEIEKEKRELEKQRLEAEILAKKIQQEKEEALQKVKELEQKNHQNFLEAIRVLNQQVADQRQKDLKLEQMRQKQQAQEEAEKLKQLEAEQLKQKEIEDQLAAQRKKLEEEKQKLAEEKLQMNKALEENRAKQELEMQRKLLEQQQALLELEKIRMKEDQAKMALEVERDRLRLEKEMLEKERERLDQDKILQQQLEKERDSLLEEKRKLDQERKSLNASRSRQLGNKSGQLDHDSSFLNVSANQNLLAGLKTPDNSSRRGSRSTHQDPNSEQKDELAREQDNLRKQREQLEAEKLKLQQERMQNEIDFERKKLDMERQKLEKERQLLDEERDRSMNEIKKLEKLGTRKKTQKNLGDNDDSESYKSTLSRPLLDVSQDEEDSIDSQIRKKNSQPYEYNDLQKQKTLAGRGKEFTESDDEYNPKQRIRNPADDRRISFGLDPSENTQKKSTPGNKPRISNNQKLLIDTDCSFVSGDRNLDFTLPKNQALKEETLNSFKQPIGENSKRKARLDHENYPGLKNSRGNKHGEKLNESINNRYDKLGLKEFISKPKLWDIFGKIANQVARKGDPKGLVDQRRLTAEFHRPSDSQKKKEDPKPFLKILAEYLNRIDIQRQRIKLKKQTDRNLKRMAQQIFNVGKKPNDKQEQPQIKPKEAEKSKKSSRASSRRKNVEKKDPEEKSSPEAGSSTKRSPEARSSSKKSPESKRALRSNTTTSNSALRKNSSRQSSIPKKNQDSLQQEASPTAKITKKFESQEIPEAYRAKENQNEIYQRPKDARRSRNSSQSSANRNLPLESSSPKQKISETTGLLNQDITTGKKPPSLNFQDKPETEPSGQNDGMNTARTNDLNYSLDPNEKDDKSEIMARDLPLNNQDHENLPAKDEAVNVYSQIEKSPKRDQPFSNQAALSKSPVSGLNESLPSQQNTQELDDPKERGKNDTRDYLKKTSDDNPKNVGLESESQIPVAQYRSNRSSQPGLPPTMPRSRNQSSPKKTTESSHGQRNQDDKHQGLVSEKIPKDATYDADNQDLNPRNKFREISPALSTNSGENKLNVLRDYAKMQKRQQSMENSKASDSGENPAQTQADLNSNKIDTFVPDNEYQLSSKSPLSEVRKKIPKSQDSEKNQHLIRRGYSSDNPERELDSPENREGANKQTQPRLNQPKQQNHDQINDRQKRDYRKQQSHNQELTKSKAGSQTGSSPIERRKPQSSYNIITNQPISPVEKKAQIQRPSSQKNSSPGQHRSIGGSQKGSSKMQDTLSKRPVSGTSKSLGKKPIKPEADIEIDELYNRIEDEDLSHIKYPPDQENDDNFYEINMSKSESNYLQNESMHDLYQADDAGLQEQPAGYVRKENPRNRNPNGAVQESLDEIDLSGHNIANVDQFKMDNDAFNAKVNKYDQDSGFGAEGSELNFDDEPGQSFIDFGDESLVDQKKDADPEDLNPNSTKRNSNKINPASSSKTIQDAEQDNKVSERHKSRKSSNFGSNHQVSKRPPSVPRLESNSSRKASSQQIPNIDSRKYSSHTPENQARKTGDSSGLRRQSTERDQRSAIDHSKHDSAIGLKNNTNSSHQTEISGGNRRFSERNLHQENSEGQLPSPNDNTARNRQQSLSQKASSGVMLTPKANQTIRLPETQIIHNDDSEVFAAETAEFDDKPIGDIQPEEISVINANEEFLKEFNPRSDEGLKRKFEIAQDTANDNAVDVLGNLSTRKQSNLEPDEEDFAILSQVGKQHNERGTKPQKPVIVDFPNDRINSQPMPSLKGVDMRELNQDWMYPPNSLMSDKQNPYLRRKSPKVTRGNHRGTIRSSVRDPQVHYQRQTARYDDNNTPNHNTARGLEPQTTERFNARDSVVSKGRTNNPYEISPSTDNDTLEQKYLIEDAMQIEEGSHTEVRKNYENARYLQNQDYHQNSPEYLEEDLVFHPDQITKSYPKSSYANFDLPSKGVEPTDIAPQFTQRYETVGEQYGSDAGLSPVQDLYSRRRSEEELDIRPTALAKGQNFKNTLSQKPYFTETEETGQQNKKLRNPVIEDQKSARTRADYLTRISANNIMKSQNIPKMGLGNQPFFREDGVIRNMFDEPEYTASATCLSPYKETITPMINLVTDNNLLIKISLETAKIIEYYFLRPVRGKVIDMLEDEQKRFYLATETELFIFQEDQKRQIRFVEYLYDSKCQPKDNTPQKTDGPWIMANKRIFADPESQTVFWWKSLREVVQIDASNKVINSFKILLNDKLKVTHGNFKAFISFCEQDKIISFLGYSFASSSFFTFSQSVITREEIQHVAVLGDFDNFLPQSFDFRFGYMAIGGLFTKTNKSNIVKRYASNIKSHDSGAVLDVYHIDKRRRNRITHLTRQYAPENTPQSKGYTKLTIANPRLILAGVGETVQVFNIVNETSVKLIRNYESLHSPGNSEIRSISFCDDVFITMGSEDNSISAVVGRKKVEDLRRNLVSTIQSQRRRHQILTILGNLGVRELDKVFTDQRLCLEIQPPCGINLGSQIQSSPL